MILYVLGIDGAGKTTVARHLAAGLTHMYGLGHPVALPYMRTFVQRLYLRRRPRRNRDPRDPAYYTAYRAVAQRRPHLARLYCWIWLLDTVWQVRRGIDRARRAGRPIVTERSYLDTVVAISVMLDAPCEAMLRLATRIERVLPRADTHLWLDASEEVAFSRKRDVHSLQYLRDRRRRYRDIADAYGAVRIDADQPLAAVLREASMAVDCLEYLSKGAEDHRHPFHRLPRSESR